MRDEPFLSEKGNDLSRGHLRKIAALGYFLARYARNGEFKNNTGDRVKRFLFYVILQAETSFFAYNQSILENIILILAGGVNNY